MQAGEKTLEEYGLKNLSKVLVLGSSSAALKLAVQEKAAQEAAARSDRLQRVKDAAAAIAKRDDRFHCACVLTGCSCLSQVDGPEYPHALQAGRR